MTPFEKHFRAVIVHYMPKPRVAIWIHMVPMAMMMMALAFNTKAVVMMNAVQITAVPLDVVKMMMIMMVVVVVVIIGCLQCLAEIKAGNSV